MENGSGRRIARAAAWLRLGLLAVLVAAGLGPASAERRVALLIGNSAYRAAPALPNAAGDADAMAAALSALGFATTVLRDGTRPATQGALTAFRRAAAEADVALLFYAGHAFEIGGGVRLVPADAALTDPGAIEAQTVRLDATLGALARPGLTLLVFLDACRDDPRPPGRRGTPPAAGPAPLPLPPDTFVAFATRPGRVTRDGAGAHSPFTAALLEHLPAADATLAEVMERVRRSVEAATFGTQSPRAWSSLRRPFRLRPGGAPAPGSRFRGLP